MIGVADLIAWCERDLRRERGLLRELDELRKGRAAADKELAALRLKLAEAEKRVQSLKQLG